MPWSLARAREPDFAISRLRGRDPPTVRGRGYRLRAGAGPAASPVRGRGGAAVHPVKRIDWAKVKSTIEAARPNPAAAALPYVFEGDDPNGRHCAIRIRQGTSCRQWFFDDPAGRIGTNVRELPAPAMQARPFARRSGRERKAICPFREHDRRGRHVSERGFRLLQALERYRRRADLNSRLNHVGRITFCGDLSSQFAAA
jgi:hypothetical protein